MAAWAHGELKYEVWPSPTRVSNELPWIWAARPCAHLYEVDGSWVALMIRIGGVPRTSRRCGGLAALTGQPRQRVRVQVCTAPCRCGASWRPSSIRCCISPKLSISEG